MWRSRTKRIILQQKGYTLLAMMIALMVLCVVAGLITSVATVTFNQMTKDSVGRKDIWLFVHQLDIELSGANNIVCKSNELTFDNNGTHVSYKKIGANFRRQMNGSGNEIVIRGFSSFECEKDLSAVDIRIIDLKGKMYRWTVQNMLE